MAHKPSGFYTEGRGNDRKVHPLFKSHGHKRQHKSRFEDPSRDQLSSTHIRSLRDRFTPYRIVRTTQLPSNYVGMNYRANKELGVMEWPYSKNTILVDASQTAAEQRQTIRHEIFEIEKMKNGAPYADAHAAALVATSKQERPYVVKFTYADDTSETVRLKAKSPREAIFKSDNLRKKQLERPTKVQADNVSLSDVSRAVGRAARGVVGVSAGVGEIAGETTSKVAGTTREFREKVRVARGETPTQYRDDDIYEGMSWNGLKTRMLVHEGYYSSPHSAEAAARRTGGRYRLVTEVGSYTGSYEVLAPVSKAWHLTRLGSLVPSRISKPDISSKTKPTVEPTAKQIIKKTEEAQKAAQFVEAEAKRRMKDGTKTKDGISIGVKEPVEVEAHNEVPETQTTETEAQKRPKYKSWREADVSKTLAEVGYPKQVKKISASNAVNLQATGVIGFTPTPTSISAHNALSKKETRRTYTFKFDEGLPSEQTITVPATGPEMGAIIARDEYTKRANRYHMTVRQLSTQESIPVAIKAENAILPQVTLADVYHSVGQFGTSVREGVAKGAI